MTCMSRSNPTCPELLLKSIWEQFVKSPRRRGESESSEGGGGIKDCFSLLLYRENIHLHCFSMTVALLPRCSQFEWFKFPCDVRVLLTAGHFLFFFFGLHDSWILTESDKNHARSTKFAVSSQHSGYPGAFGFEAGTVRDPSPDQSQPLPCESANNNLESFAVL